MSTLNPEALTSLNQPQQEVRRDRWGRYQVLPPRGDKPVGYTRATTIAKILDDSSSLMAWNSRMTAIGLGLRPDLVALVATTPQDDKKTLDSLVKRASEAGGATVRRDLGTAVHGLLERRLKDPSFVAPDPYQADIEAVLSALADAGLSFVDGMTERIVVNDEIEVAGTFDLALTDGQEIFVSDLKTGSSVKYGGLAFAIQLSIYANASNLYTQGSAKDGSEDIREPMPEFSKSAGIIIHCQPGSGLAELHWLDLEAGTEALHTALEVRRLRKLTPIHPFTPQQATAALYGRQRPGQVTYVDEPWRKATRDRISAIVVDGHAQALADAWPDDHPTLKSGDPITIDQGDGISRVLDVLEKELGLPFASLPDLNPPPEPPKKSTRRRAVNDGLDTLIHTDIINRLNDQATHLPDASLEWVKKILDDAKQCGRTLALSPPQGIPAERRYLICQAIIALAVHRDDELAWTVLDNATAQKVPHHSLGDAFGTLRKAEAKAALGIVQAINNLDLIPMWDENGCRLEGDIVTAMKHGFPTDKETQQ
jgi:hypothetical protein